MDDDEPAAGDERRTEPGGPSDPEAQPPEPTVESSADPEQEIAESGPQAETQEPAVVSERPSGPPPDWISRVREHAPWLLEEGEPNVSRPPVVPRRRVVAAQEAVSRDERERTVDAPMSTPARADAGPTPTV